MKEFEAAVNQRGQITIPVEIRSYLGLKPGDKIAFELEGDQVKLRRRTSSAHKWYGSVTPQQRPEDFRKIRNDFEEGVADETQ